jgi:transposase-like protein
VKTLTQVEEVKPNIKRNTASNSRILQKNLKKGEKKEVILIDKCYNNLTVPAFESWPL